MIRIAICDDDNTMCRQIEKMVSILLTQWNRSFTIACHTNPFRLLLSSARYDLIFLDIQMPGLNGMETARRLREDGFWGPLVFITVLTDYMADAFEIEAADYLCKPIDGAHLERTLLRTLKRLDAQQEQSLFIQTKNWCRSVKFCDIYYCEVINRKIHLHTRNGILNYYGKMKELEQQLASRFIKCHRSFLINPDYLLEYADGQITLEDGSHIPVSRQQRQTFMEQMLSYMDGRN